MADSKISALTDGSPAQATDEIPAARAGSNVRLTAQDIADLHSDAVSSVNGQTGAVSLDASDVGAPSAGFTTVAVSGQSNVVADSTSDTLTLAAGSNVTITTEPSTDTVTIAASSAPSDFQPAIVTNYYYTNPYIEYIAEGTIDQAMYALPFWCSHTVTWTRIGVSVISTNAGEVARLGIYENGTDNRPGSLLLDAGEISASASGDVEKTISQSLTSNTLYWLVLGGNGTTLATYAGDNGKGTRQNINYLLGAVSSPKLGEGTYIQGAFTYGALPSSFGTVEASPSSFLPLIWLRKV